MTLRQSLTVQQGATFSHVYTHRNAAGTAIDLTGYTARMAIAEYFGGPALAYLSTGSDASGGTITLGGAAGTVTLAMTATQTEALADSWGAYADVVFAEWEAGSSGIVSPRTVPANKPLIYDLELVSGAGVVTRAIEGGVDLRRSVTS